jgi:alkanesulfonate monooxygenase SsuD/methylene tetrahydromethanopterin reductase-like flavin-dependent oxidoreductase (luciferase family)
MDPGRSVGERLDWLDEALDVVRGLLDGQTVTHQSARYRFDDARHAPRPVQARVPFVVGSSGERKGLRIVARHADIWQMWLAMDDLALFEHKRAVLHEHCRAVGREPAAIEHTIGGKLVIRATADDARHAFDEQIRFHGWTDPIQTQTAWTGTSRDVARALIAFRAAGADAFSPSIAAPLDLETVERLATEVRPQVEAA